VDDVDPNLASRHSMRVPVTIYGNIDTNTSKAFNLLYFSLFLYVSFLRSSDACPVVVETRLRQGE